jgi:hypothetical protein
LKSVDAILQRAKLRIADRREKRLQEEERDQINEVGGAKTAPLRAYTASIASAGDKSTKNYPLIEVRIGSVGWARLIGTIA